MELNERAQGRIDEIRRANALKSQQKIKELTAQHALQKKDKVARQTVEGNVSSVVDDAVMEETKAEPRKNGHKNGKPREPLEGEKAKSKNTVAASKLANKRSQKEAIRKNKEKRNKGTVKDGTERPKSAQPTSAAE